MLFDLKPKEKLSDFFNYRNELDALVNYLKDKNTRMVVIRGLRRTGKSSLLKVGLSKAKIKFVLLDVRELTSLNRQSFESKLFEELKSLKTFPISLLEKIESIDAGIRFSVKQKETLWKILKQLNPVIAVDEVQMLKGTGVEAFFAALYDNTNCKIVLTGSEIGVLDAFVGKDDSKAPLFGRLYSEIKMHSLPVEKSMEFLHLGFKENSKKISENEIANALQELDGIVGWLAMFGNLSLSANSKTALAQSVQKGAQLAYAELESFLGMRLPAKKRYLALMALLAREDLAWSGLKRGLQLELNEVISDPQFANYLDSLTAYGFLVSVNGKYSIPDPLLKKALWGN